MMCTRIYPGLSNQFAFAIGGESQPGKLTGAHIAELARTFGVGVRYLQKLALDVAQQVAVAVPAAAAELAPGLDDNNAIMAERLAQRIKSIATGMGKRFAGLDIDVDSDAGASAPDALPGR